MNVSRSFFNKHRRGFTIIELIIFMAIFTLSMLAFVTILVTVTRIQTQQLASTEVAQQSQFLLQQLQYYIANSSLIDIPQDTATTTLRLRMSGSSLDPTIINTANGIVYLQQGNGPKTPLTSARVNAGSLTFTKHSNPPGHDSVSLSFALSYNTTNIQQAFSEMFQTSVTRVSAANFDSNLYPSSTNTYSLGNVANAWTNVNGVIDFNGPNVGIAVTPNTARFEVGNGDMYVDTTGHGLILRSPDGTCWKITATNGGTLNTTSSTCP